MRVMQVMAGADHGGAETYFVDLTRALARAGLEQRLVIRRDRARAATLAAAGIAPLELPFGGFFDRRTRRDLAREIAEFQPDIVQTWMNRASRHCPAPGNFIHVGWFGGYYDLKYYRGCHHLVGVTPDIVSHQVAGGWPAGRAHYLPTFAEQRRVPPVSRASLATPEGVPLILALGRLHWKKAFDILLTAMKDVPDAYLWLAGEGVLQGKLKAQAAALGISSRVRFLGWRDDREALLAAADLCVMPSRYEPFGTVMIEAWAQDVPLVAAAAAGPRGLIRSGENAMLVPVDDAAALAKAMARVLGEPGLRDRLVATARAEFQTTFTEAAVVKKYLSFYNALMRERAG